MLHCVLLKGPYTRPTPVTPMTPSRKKTKKRNSEDGITEAVARELESIAEELKTSTVSYSKVRLRALAARLRAHDRLGPDIWESDRSERESVID